MLPLPHGRILLAIGWALIAFIVYGSLTPGLPSLVTSFSDKLQHFLGYFLLMIWFAGLYPRRQHWLLALGFFVLGMVLELGQSALTTTRQMDASDVLANTAGIAAGYVFAGFGLANWARWIEAWLTRNR
jgi:VanZ family protein